MSRVTAGHETCSPCLRCTVPLRRPVQRLPVRLWNAARSRRRGRPRPDLSVEALKTVAVKTTGLSDFGDESFVAGLELLVQSLQQSARLHSFGESYAHVVLVQLLRNRLYIENEWAQHPEIHDIPITRPIVVLGLPRTGTTLLFNLLARDPKHRFLTNWEALQPVPPPRRWARARWVRRGFSAFSLAALNFLAPSFRVIHEVRVDGPEECGPLLMNEFAFRGFGMTFNVPEYMYWLDDYDYGAAIRYHHRQLQLLQTQRGEKRWVLKSPAHMATLGSLMQSYPDACIVQTHRDPAKAVASECSLVAALRGIATASLDGAEIGEQIAHVLACDLERCARERERYDRKQFFDLLYRDLVSDPIKAVHDIYDHFGLALAEPADRRMRAELQSSPSAKWGGHRYSLDQFGLDADSLRERFRWYFERYDLRREH